MLANVSFHRVCRTITPHRARTSVVIWLLLSQNTSHSCAVLCACEKAVSTPITLMFRAFSHFAARLAVFGRRVKIAGTPVACLTSLRRVPVDNNDKIIV